MMNLRLHRSAWALLFALALVVVGSGTTAASTDAVENVIDREQPASGAPGVAYAVVVDGEVTQVGARGVLELGKADLVTPDTPFLSGSISKSFTALAIMQLTEAGTLDLDAELARYLDRFEGQPAGSVTLRQLLSHTSGFSTLQGNASHGDPTGGPDELARSVEHVLALRPAHAIGSTWEYSNLNYRILGRVIEVVSAQDYQSYVESNILAPLQMKHSFVADGRVHESMATGHTPWFGSKRPVADTRTHRATAPQGGVVSSAQDLALYMSAMMNGRDDILSADGKAAMMRPANDASPYYGLGWFVDTEKRTVWHSGSSPGVETLATLVPTERKAVVVLVNAGSGIGFRETGPLIHGITASALGLNAEGDGGRWGQKLMFVALVLMPLAFALSMGWAWKSRDALRAKSGAFGAFSLWFPLCTTLGVAVSILVLLPKVIGAPMHTLRVFQPDLALVLQATAVTGVAWAVFRLGVAYSRRRIP